MSTTNLWISYDLGINGDYESLYTWLASQHAEECGDSVAYLPKYEYQGDVVNALRRDLAREVNLGKRARIYAIFKKSDGTPKGKFLYGGRKLAPWHGYEPSSGEDVDDEG